jgi:hypothetical protein
MSTTTTDKEIKHHQRSQTVKQLKELKQSKATKRGEKKISVSRAYLLGVNQSE